MRFCVRTVSHTPPKPWSNTVTYGDTLKRIVVAGSRRLGVRWWVSVCVSTRERNQFPSVLLQPLGNISCVHELLAFGGEQSVQNRTPFLLGFSVVLPSVEATGRWRERGRMGQKAPAGRPAMVTKVRRNIPSLRVIVPFGRDLPGRKSIFRRTVALERRTISPLIPSLHPRASHQWGCHRFRPPGASPQVPA